MDRPRKITAQVAPYLDAIRQARTGGWGWREIAERVAPGAAADAVRAAVKCCKYQVDQKPLPEPERLAEEKQKTPAITVEEQGQSRKLPRVGSSSEVSSEDEDSMTEAQRVLASIPRIGG